MEKEEILPNKNRTGGVHSLKENYALFSNPVTLNPVLDCSTIEVNFKSSNLSSFGVRIFRLT